MRMEASVESSGIDELILEPRELGICWECGIRDFGNIVARSVICVFMKA